MSHDLLAGRVASVPVIAPKSRDSRQEKTPCSDLACVKLDFLIGKDCRSNVGRKVKSGGTSLSERRIKILPLSPYSSKIWRKNPAKVLILKDRPWEGGYPRYRPVNPKHKKYLLPKQPPKKFIFVRTNGERRPDFSVPDIPAIVRIICTYNMYVQYRCCTMSRVKHCTYIMAATIWPFSPSAASALPLAPAAQS